MVEPQIKTAFELWKEEQDKKIDGLLIELKDKLKEESDHD